MKFTAVGDAIIQQNIPEDYNGFEEIKDFISKGDARFFNLETTLNEEGECYASQFSGGTYLRTNPCVLKDLKKFGFNMVNFNNNHSMDFSYDGLLKTIEHIKASGLVQSGVGRNLDEASAPKYLDTKNGRVALISVNTSFDPSMMAGVQSKRVKGRPGINGLRYNKTQIVTKDDFEVIKRVGTQTGINNEIINDIKDGYLSPWPDDVCCLENIRFMVGEKTGQITTINETDMKRVEKAIFDAQLQADYILISLHTHEMEDINLEITPKFIEEFCRRCIDCGAHAIIGHGPHLLRGIEVYKERPIFYSLGDFILQLYSVEFAPEDFYSKYGLTSGDGIYSLIKTRSKDFNIGLMEKNIYQEAIIPYWEMENGKLTKLELLPITCYKQNNKSVSGLPVVNFDTNIAERLVELSKPYGVDMEVENGIIHCKW